MSVKWTAGEEKNTGVLEFEISRELIEKYLDRAYENNKNKISAPGFRKGKMPKQLFFQKFGEEGLYQEVMDMALPVAYAEALAQEKLKAVGRPNIDIIGDMKKGESWKIKADVTLQPEIILGEYKGVEVPKSDLEVTDQEVEDRLKAKQAEEAELVVLAEDQAAANEDTVVIDFVGSVDGVEFDGGKAENFNLELGSGSFIPGFEDQLVGHKAGEEVKVEVKFPEEYHAEELAGKDAVFEVKINEVKRKELPELDDEFAKDVDEEVSTLAELKDKYRKAIEESKKHAAEHAKEENAIDKVVENAKVDGDVIPAVMIDEDVERQMQQYMMQLQSQGISKEIFFQISGQTEESLREQFAADAEKRVKTSMVLEKIVDTENFDITDEELAEEVKSIAERYQTTEENVKANISDEMIKHDIALQKVVDMIVSNAKEV